MNTRSSIQGQLLDVTVVAWNNSRDAKQKHYARLEYANFKFRTKTCTGGKNNSTFQETTQTTLIEGLRELEIEIWSKSFGRHDILIGTGRIQLNKVLSNGYDDSSWPIRTKDFRAAGEVKLIMHYSGASHNASESTSCAYPPGSPYPYGPPPQYAYLPPASVYPPACGYPYTAPPSASPPYPGAGYPPPHNSPYHPAAYPSAQYPPYGQAYPPPPAAQPP